MDALEGPVQRSTDLRNRLEERAKELPVWFEEVRGQLEEAPEIYILRSIPQGLGTDSGAIQLGESLQIRHELGNQVEEAFDKLSAFNRWGAKRREMGASACPKSF
jgi:hypothetical protein